LDAFNSLLDAWLVLLLLQVFLSWLQKENLMSKTDAARESMGRQAQQHCPTYVFDTW